MGCWLENETHDINWVTCSGISGAYSLQMQIRLTRASIEWLKHGEQPHWVHSCISCKSWGTASNETLDLLKKFHVEQIICHSPSLAFSQKNKKMDPQSKWSYRWVLFMIPKTWQPSPQFGLIWITGEDWSQSQAKELSDFFICKIKEFMQGPGKMQNKH